MAHLDDLLPEILVEVDGCPLTLAERELRHTIRLFCRDTHYWREDMEPITLVPFVQQAPDTYIYNLPVPEGTELIAIDSLVYQFEQEIKPESSGWLNENMGNWRTSEGDPLYYIRMSTKTVRFVPHSREVQPVAINGRIVLMPDRVSKEFGDELLEYGHGLIQGCLYNLLTMPKPWANGDRATVCRVDYLEAVSLAKMAVMREFSDGVQMTTRRSWL